MADSADSSVILFTIEEEIATIPGVEGARDGRDIGGGFGERTRTGNSLVAQVLKRTVSVPSASLKAQINGLLQVMTDLAQSESQIHPSMVLDEVELSIEVTAEGQLSIAGNGGKLSDKGAIKLKFKRATP